MFKTLILQILIRRLPDLLCELFGICLEDDECDNGICLDGIRIANELRDLESVTPVSAIGTTNAPTADFCFDCLPELIDAIKSLIIAIRKVLGKDHTVGN